MKIEFAFTDEYVNGFVKGTLVNKVLTIKEYSYEISDPIFLVDVSHYVMRHIKNCDEVVILDGANIWE